MKEMNEYVLEQCQDGDVLLIVWSMGESSAIDLAGKHCKAGTIHSFRAGLVFVNLERKRGKSYGHLKRNGSK